MKKVKQLKGWQIFKNSPKEVAEYGFEYTLLHPDNVGVPGLNPSDSDWECDTMEECISWINNYVPYKGGE